MDISELLFELSKRDCIGNVREAADYEIGRAHV